MFDDRRLPDRTTPPPLPPANGQHFNNHADHTHNALSMSASAMKSNNFLSPSAYQIFSLRPTRTDTPETLRGKLNDQMQQHFNEAQNESTDGMEQIIKPTIVPLVLDFSALHPDGSPHCSSAEKGTLSEFVNAIRSNSMSQIQPGTGYCLVGVTNLPPHDQSIASEAHSLGLPIFPGNNQHDYGPRISEPSLAATNDGTNSLNTITPKRKKRGGVAPLLRQRRPGVAATDKTMEADATATTTTLTTRDDVSSPSSNNETSSNIQIVGMGQLPAYDQLDNSTKVHKGSIRSGQLVSSDRPNQSLVIIGSVNPGGEIWSEGDVYVFGKLRGRVMAGLSNVDGGDAEDSKGGDNAMGHDGKGGDGTNGQSQQRNNSSYNNENTVQEDVSPSREKRKLNSSKIFATSFDPELVCIGSTFTTIDSVAQSCGLPDDVGPAVVSLDEVTGELLFERIEL